MTMPQQIPSQARPAAPPPEGRIEPDIQDHIGRQLRAVYNEVLDEPVPDRFLRLLADLESKRGTKS
jgi:hypothetical protein